MLYVSDEDLPARHLPWFVLGLVAANVLVHLGVALLAIPDSVFRQFGFVCSRPTPGTALSSMFLHADIVHLVGNMFFLWMFGDNVEDMAGPLPTALCYVIAGLGAKAAFWMLHMSTDTPLVGASGAISGMAGMYAVLYPRAKTRLSFHALGHDWLDRELPSLVALAAWFGWQVLLAAWILFAGLEENASIAFASHAGGFATGAMLALVLRWLGYVRRFEVPTARHRILGYAFDGE